jgi:hypothetical protein
MSQYRIKTDKFNIFTGTRAEAIVADLGDNRRIVTGAIPFVLPAVATLRDLDIVNPGNKDIPIEVVVDSLQPAAILQQGFTPDQLFYGMLNAFYGVDVQDQPKTRDPAIVVVDMVDEPKKIEKGFRAVDRYSRGIAELLAAYGNAAVVFAYSGNVSAAPEKRMMSPLKRAAKSKKAHCVNTKGHNPFFNTHLAEMLEDLGREEIVIVGKQLEDRVFYTAINAKDLDYKPEITVLPEYIVPELEFGRPVAERTTGSEILAKHFKETLGARTKYDAMLARRSRDSGVTVYLE